MTGWWFGTCFFCFFNDFPYIGNFIPPTDFHIFQRGRSTTNQMIFMMMNGRITLWLFHLHVSWKHHGPVIWFFPVDVMKSIPMMFWSNPQTPHKPQMGGFSTGWVLNECFSDVFRKTFHWGNRPCHFGLDMTQIWFLVLIYFSPLPKKKKKHPAISRRQLPDSFQFSIML